MIQEQMRFGEVAIGDIKFDIRSRDEIPKLLMGLQAIYCNLDVRRQVFEVLVNLIPDDINPNNGRTGMDLWKILVLGTLRLSCNWDYDKLMEIANNHDTLRLMLGHSRMDNDFRYHSPCKTIGMHLNQHLAEPVYKGVAVGIVPVLYAQKI